MKNKKLKEMFGIFLFAFFFFFLVISVCFWIVFFFFVFFVSNYIMYTSICMLILCESRQNTF